MKPHSDRGVIDYNHYSTCYNLGMKRRRATQSVIQYVERYGDYNFWRLPFNEVDSLILSTLCYADLAVSPFGKISNFNCTLSELDRLVETERLGRLMWNRVRGAELLRVCAGSSRFGEVLLHHYRHQVDSTLEEQFGAVTFSINTDRGYLDYLAFQGTDDSLAGWKEDLNMTFRRHLPAQQEALHYLQMIAGLSQNWLMLGGHSKGGNLAVYAGLMADRAIRDRIVAVYNHDGPGFLAEIFSPAQWRNLKGRIHSTVPEGALVGLLLDEQAGDGRVVQSDARLINQHDSLSWRVDGTRLATVGHVSRSSRYVNRTIRRWLGELTLEQRKAFADALYRMLIRANCRTTDDLRRYLAKHWHRVLHDVRTSDPETRRVVVRTFKLLASSSGRELLVSMVRWFRRLLGKR